MENVNFKEWKVQNDKVIYTSGEYSYELLPFWAQIPKEFNSKAEITSVGCDSENNVFVLTRDFNMPIMVFDRNGAFQYSFGKGVFYARPHGVFINAKNEVYCTDDKAHVAMKFSREGELLQTYGKPNQPSDSGCNWNAYAEYRKANNIPDNAPRDGVFDLKLRLDTIVRSAPPFNGPTKMIEAPDGSLFCSDGYGNASIHHFDYEGNLISTFGSPGYEPGQFRLPHAILLDDKGRIWEADRENNRVQIFTQDGELVKCIEGMDRPADLATDGSDIYVSQTTGGGFVIFNQEGVPKARIGYSKSSLYFHGFALDSFGDVYGATLGKNRDFNIVKMKRVK